MSTTSYSITVTDPKAAVTEWFERLGRYCAAVDYDSTRKIFSTDVVSFGTKADIVAGLDYLQQKQWTVIWPNIQYFKINLESILSGGDERIAWGAATWTSTGFNEDGTGFSRPGRATTVLERRDGQWLSVHTHISLNPGTPSRTYGPQM